MTYTRHYLSAIFPDMNDEEFAELVTDIEKNGCINPVQVVGSQIVDGWHRYRACQIAGIEPVEVRGLPPIASTKS